MKLIIELPEEDYIRLRDEGMFGNVTTFKRAVREGILLEEHEPCTDVISREAVLKAIDAKAWEFCDYLISKGRNDEQKPVSHFADNLRECISEDLPSVTPAEKVGHWIARGLVDSNGNRIYECSECHHSDTQAATMIVPYCWYCGSKMQEVME